MHNIVIVLNDYASVCHPEIRIVATDHSGVKKTDCVSEKMFVWGL